VQKPKTEKARKLSFKERQEFESLEKELPRLEREKAELEAQMSSGSLSPDALQKAGIRMTALIEEIDGKEMRWLELSEFA
jgi:ATP-binding cassette subfamily F protein uup